MNEQEYLKKAKRTLSTKDDLLEHMAYGLSTEAGEILDAFKKHKFYGRDLNIQNLKEEAGDLMWYLYQFLEGIGYTPEQCRADNIAKLEKRYPEKFKDVVNRNVEDELSHIGDDAPEDIVNDVDYLYGSTMDSITVYLRTKAEERTVKVKGNLKDMANIATFCSQLTPVGKDIDEMERHILEIGGVE